MGKHSKDKDRSPAVEEKKKHQKKRKSDAAVTPESEAKRNKTNPLVAGPSAMGGVKAPDVGAAGGEAVIATLEEKLNAYSMAMLADEANSSKQKLSAEASRVAPSSDSLVVLVEQSLQSGDDVLLEQCLSCDDKDIIDATTSKLPTAKIFLFMRRLISKFEKRPSRGLLLTRWLSAVLKHHASYLISLPELSSRFAGLSQIMEQRLASYSRLASLGGRLDLLMSHVSSQAVASGSAGGSDMPRVTFREP
jgi:U3 small nucleolar RNA-associated protein 5